MAAEYVYCSVGASLINSAKVEQRNGDDLSLVRTESDLRFAQVANGKVWCVGINGNANTLFALNADDISQTVHTTAITTLWRVRCSNDRVYTSVQSGNANNDKVSRIDPDDGTILWTTTGGMGLSPDEMVDDADYVYVASIGTSPFRVSKLRISDGVVDDFLTLSIGRPTGMALIGDELFVAADVTPRLERIDTITMSSVATYTLTNPPEDVITDGTDLFFGSGNNLLRWSPSSGSTAEQIATTYNHAALTYLDGDLYSVGTGTVTNVGEMTYATTSPLTQVTTAAPVGRLGFDVAAWSQAVPPTPTAGWVVGSVGW